MTIDLSNLNQVVVSDDQSQVSIGPGNRWEDVYLKLDALDIATSGGRASSVGVGGLTLGGTASYSFHVIEMTDLFDRRIFILFPTIRPGVRQCPQF